LFYYHRTVNEESNTKVSLKHVSFLIQQYNEEKYSVSFAVLSLACIAVDRLSSELKLHGKFTGATFLERIFLAIQPVNPQNLSTDISPQNLTTLGFSQIFVLTRKDRQEYMRKFAAQWQLGVDSDGWFPQISKL